MSSKMNSRAIKAVDKQIQECLENLNTWSSLLKRFIKLNRQLSGNHVAHKKAYKLAGEISKLHYQDFDSDSDLDSDLESYDENPKRNRRKGTDKEESKEDKTKTPTEDIDVDEFLHEVIRAEKERADGKKPPGKLTKMQEAARKVLTVEDLEAKELDEHVSRRRKQMQEDMANPPKKDVKFTLDIDAKDDSESDSESGEVLEEVEIYSDTEDAAGIKTGTQTSGVKHPAEADLETSLKSIMKNVYDDASMHPLIAMQNEAPLFDGLPGLDTQSEQANTQLNTQSNTQPIPSRPDNLKIPEVKFISVDTPPDNARMGPLYKLTTYQRKNLLQKFFLQAKKNVELQLGGQSVSQEKFNELVKGESDRILYDYVDTHK